MCLPRQQSMWTRRTEKRGSRVTSRRRPSTTAALDSLARGGGPRLVNDRISKSTAC
jgi:hypothetical protein